ncbi:hypothetical protein BGW38_010591 [Lunasporangiospora selenospora]|uniref:L-lactate dehydrogenase n=1 Tax=Lunasporangiospora selenospora TaxID=979761 RepID=A0A9P6G2Q4_9FUNG|nr:hypothetical protein BGW38_010591 [Lunasporangiospora selenospora]
MKPNTVGPNTANKVAIIGTGIVGASVAFACLMRGVASEYLLYDLDESLAWGHTLDLEDSAFISSAELRAIQRTNAQECGQADIIVIAAGYRQGPGETRDMLLTRNENILKDVIHCISPIKSSAIVIMATNPVNILTDLAQRLTGLPRSQVFGSGTYLDTIRLRTAIKKALQGEVEESSIQAYVLGDHGDKQVAIWSSATIAGTTLTSFEELEHMITREKIAHATATKIYEIIEHKGASSYGIAAVVTELILAITMNKRTVIPLTVYSERYDACLSLPSVLGVRGIERIFYPAMNPKEQALLEDYVMCNRVICAKYRIPELAAAEE